MPHTTEARVRSDHPIGRFVVDRGKNKECSPYRHPTCYTGRSMALRESLARLGSLALLWNPMNTPLAIALIVVGIVLLLVGLGSTDSIQNAFSRLFSGQFTDRTTLLIVGGCVCAVVGLVGCFRRARA